MGQKEFKRFNMIKPPTRQRSFLMPIGWLACFPAKWLHRYTITKVNMEGLKPPYLLLCNHNAFLDLMITTTAIFPHRANYIAAIDGFIGREWLLRQAGCICKRKFTSDVQLLYQLRRVVKNKDIAVIFPEARYSLCGTTSDLPDALFGITSYLNVPVVTLIMHGHHVNSPFWNTGGRGAKPLEATMTQIITAEEAALISNEEVAKRIKEKFVYDDFAWQRDNHIKIKYKNRAKRLHRILYKCPNCNTEYKTESFKNIIRCKACGKNWIMSEYGELSASSGDTEFTHIPDWYEWQRDKVKEEIKEGRYSFSSKVIVRSLPNARGHINLGEGLLTHNSNGFKLVGNYQGEHYEIKFPVKSMYACHIEYNYLGKYGDCVDLNTLTDTYYCYPQTDEFSVTKLALATEELFKLYREEQCKNPDSEYSKSLVSRFRK
ncbi:MAG: hypothetical protein A2Y15_00310 [Clostridiales bacterium GWF2_36_10]|nr:MAG: hypothetical protein A2Y15_00310 [Clostridiales bacterium GWF2_36_10]